MSPKHHDPRYAILEDVVAKYLKPLAEELRPILKGADPDGTIVYEVISWPNPADGHVAGVVGIGPSGNHEGESLDADISITLNQGEPNRAKFAITILWSDGEIVDEILEQEVTYNTVDDLADEIDRLIAQSDERLTERMKALASVKHPPKLRVD